MKRFVSLVLAFVFCVSPGLVMAETHTHEDAGVQIWFPDDFEVSFEDGVLSAGIEDEVSFTATIIEAEDVEAALEMVGEALEGSGLSEFEGEEPEEHDFNGLPGMTAAGTAMAGDVPVDLGMALVVTPSGQVLFLFGITEEGGWEANAETLAKIGDSIAPL